MEKGDFVKGLPSSNDRYCITNEKMTRAVVIDVPSDDSIRIKILDHTDDCTGSFTVASEHFEVTGHVKTFNREEVLTLLREGCKKALLDYDLQGADLTGADLTGADLTGADLTRADLTGADLTGAKLTGAKLNGADLTGAKLNGANLDFSCWPLWCGSRNVIVDKRIAAQLAFHLCSMQCDDAEYIAMRNSILAFANQFHRIGECGVLQPIELPAAAEPAESTGDGE